VDLVGSQLCALEGLRQRTTVIGTQDRQHGEPFADLQLGFGELGLGGDGSTAVIVGGTPIVMSRQQAATGGATPAVELDRVQTQYVETETNGALGVTGASIENEALGPFGCLALTDRKSTRLNSSHVKISYAVFCLKKKKKNTHS